MWGSYRGAMDLNPARTQPSSGQKPAVALFMYDLARTGVTVNAVRLANALVARGHEVRHVLGLDAAPPHRMTAFARVDGARIRYDGGQLALGGTRR